MVSRVARAASAAALLLGIGVSLAAAPAAADWRHGHRYHGGDVAAGVLGGLALGVIAGGALAGSLPPPPPPVYYRPVRPTYIYEEPEPVVCYWTRRKVWLDSFTYQVRRIRVCD